VKRWLTFHGAATEVHRKDPGISKDSFAQTLAGRFGLEVSRSVFHAEDFAVRFCYSNDAGFSNCVISLATLKKYDDRPFLVCLLKPSGVQTFLANSTLIKKASHSSQKLTLTCVRGTILGHDILRELNGVSNVPENFEALYEVHAGFNWDENLERIVAETTAISPTGKQFDSSPAQVAAVLNAPQVSLAAESSRRLHEIEGQLQKRLAEREREILEAAETDNVKLRGDTIERLIKGDESFHGLEDMAFEVRGKIRVLVDLKTKVLSLSSSPKLYNIDKALRELADGSSVFCVFLIGIDRQGHRVVGRLVDILDTALIEMTRVQFHWAGRNSRGVTQLAGDVNGFFNPTFARRVDAEKARAFLAELLKAT
jgi:hypothetical protein